MAAMSGVEPDNGKGKGACHHHVAGGKAAVLAALEKRENMTVRLAEELHRCLSGEENLKDETICGIR